MMLEFERYGLSVFRKWVGLLELLGGLGLALGYFFSWPILSLSAAGLSLLMLLGVFVRLRIRDPWLQILPAFVFMLTNGYLFYLSLKMPDVYP